MQGQALTVLLLVAVAYLIYKVHRLERLLEDGGRVRRRAPEGDGKVIPILKDQIEPGPFKSKNSRPKDSEH